MNVRVSTLGWHALAKGLEAPSCIVEQLKINLVEFDRETLTTLSEGIKKNQSIQVLDLSYNNLRDSYGDIFARIISAQTQNRDQVKWKKQLRILDININSKTKDHVGLKELILTHNRFSGIFLRNVLTAVKDDNYLRVLDLKHNKFTSKVLEDTSSYDFIKSL